MQFNHILVVCAGNICRSPTAEYMLKGLLPHKHISSAGIATERSRLTGKPADDAAKTVASGHGLDISQHQARQLTPELCRENDLILVMEKGHINAVADICAEARGKTMLLGQWLGQREIPDPYQKSTEAYEQVYNLLEQATQAWVSKLP